MSRARHGNRACAEAVASATAPQALASCNGIELQLPLMAADLCLTEMSGSFRLEARSVLGLLWLQTHFESDTWELVCSGDVRISAASSLDLQRDASAAGLTVHRIQVRTAA